VLSRGQYEALTLMNPFTEPLFFGRQLAWYFRLTAPILSLPWLRHQTRKSIILLLLAWLLFAIGVLIGMNPQLDIQNTFITRVTFIPSFALLALLIGLKNSEASIQETE